MIPADLEPDSPTTIDWLRRVRRAAQRADRIVTPSDYSKERIVATLNISEDRVSVIPWAPHPTMRHVAEPEAITATKLKYQLDTNDAYILTFGAIDPRKNTEGLLHAYAHLPESLRSRFRLLVIGMAPSGMEHYKSLGPEAAA